MTNTKPLKVVLLGDPGTGKTSLSSRLRKNEFNTQSEPTDGINFGSHTLVVGDHRMKMDLWDLAGHKEWRRLADGLLRDANGVLLVYDVSNPATFENLAAWLRRIRQAVPPKTIIKLVGNKNDLQSMVPRNEAELFAADNGLSYIETSALNDSHVHMAFESIAQEIDVTMHSVSEPLKASSDEDQQEKPFQVVLIDIMQAAIYENIVCVEKPLDEANLEFIAISYRWGEVQEQVIDTKIGYVASVTSFALTDFYKLCLDILNEPDLQSIKYVWVDAICVDQNNHARRKATIYQMSNIYRRATYILAVPDLHLEYLKNNRIFSDIPRDVPANFYDFIYYLLHEKTDQLVQITEKWFDDMNIPKDTMARKKLTSSLSAKCKRFTEYFEMYNVQVSDSLCDDSCKHNCYLNQFDLKKNVFVLLTNKAYRCNCHDTLKAMIGHIQYAINSRHIHPINTNMVYENSDCALCSLQMDMCQHQRKSLNKNEIIPDSDQKWLACVIRELRYENYENLVTDYAKAVADFIGYLEYLIKDWSSRVWVISEYNIAKAKGSCKMKFWFLSMRTCSIDNEKPSFFGIDFDKLDLIPKSDDLFNFVISEANDSYLRFQETLRSQLNERSFLEMMLDSKASRNEDRFYAIFPSSEYKTMLTSREMVSSWQIDTIVSVKLKLFELMTTKDKLNLLYSTADSSLRSDCTFPAFANINMGTYTVAPIEERSEEDQPCNFDLNNKATLRLVPPDVLPGNENGHHFHKLNLTPKMYYVYRIYGNKYYKARLYFDNYTFWQALDINYTDDDLVFVQIPMYMHYIDGEYNSKCIVLYGSFEKNKWLLCQTPQGNNAIDNLPSKDYDNSDGNTSFDIY